MKESHYILKTLSALMIMEKEVRVTEIFSICLIYYIQPNNQNILVWTKRKYDRLNQGMKIERLQIVSTIWNKVLSVGINDFTLWIISIVINLK